MIQIQPKTPLIATALLIAILPILAALAPRGLAYAVPVIGLISYTSLSITNKALLRVPMTVIAALAGTLLLSAASVLWGYDSDAITFEKTAKLAPIFLGLGLLISVSNHYKDQLHHLLSVALPLGCIAGGLLLLTDFYGDNLVYRTMHGGEITYKPGNFSHLNRPIVAITLMSLISLGLLMRSSVRHKHGIISAMTLTLGLLAYNTHSQSVQLALVIAIVAFIASPHRLRYGWIALSIAIAALLFSTPFLTQWMYGSIAELTTQYKFLTHGYAAPRMEIWDFISRKALESPLLGHGIEATRSISDFDVPHIYQIEPTILHPHNFAVQIWIEFGALGALWFSGIFALTLRSIWASTPSARRIQTTLLITIMAMATISYGMWQGWWVGTIGLCFALAQIFNREDV